MKSKHVLAKIIRIEPFGLKIEIEGEKNWGFVYEKEISDNFIPDLKLKFKVGEFIFVSPFKEEYKTKDGKIITKKSYSYKQCHKFEYSLDPLYLKILNDHIIPLE